jgi:hypothetical protein
MVCPVRLCVRDGAELGEETIPPNSDRKKTEVYRRMFIDGRGGQNSVPLSIAPRSYFLNNSHKPVRD